MARNFQGACGADITTTSTKTTKTGGTTGTIEAFTATTYDFLRATQTLYGDPDVFARFCSDNQIKATSVSKSIPEGVDPEASLVQMLCRDADAARPGQPSLIAIGTVKKGTPVTEIFMHNASGATAESTLVQNLKNKTYNALQDKKQPPAKRSSGLTGGAVLSYAVL